VLAEAADCRRRRSKPEAEVVLQETVSSEATDIVREDSRREAEAIAHEDVFSLPKVADADRGSEIAIAVDTHMFKEAVRASDLSKHVDGSPAVEVTAVDADDNAIGALTDERSTDVRSGLAHRGVRCCYARRREQAQRQCEHGENADKDQLEVNR